MKNIKWGLIGLGKIAAKFAQDLVETEGATIQAVASRNGSKAQAFAEEFKAECAYGSYEELINDKSLDVIYIATPHSHHYALVMRCLEAGQNVLCEKAFAINKRQVERMVAKAKEKQVFLMEGMWSRFNPAIIAARQDVEEGLIGKLRAVKADFCFNFPYDPESRLCNKELAGGSLLDIGIYPIFLAYFMLGKPVRMNVEAEYYPNGTDKNLIMLFDYADGSEAMLNCSLEYFSPCDGFFYGDEGCIRLNGRWHEASSYTRLVKSMDDPITKEYGERSLSFKYQIDEVNLCISERRQESDKWTWQNSIDLMEIMDAVRKEVGLDYGELETI